MAELLIWNIKSDSGKGGFLVVGEDGNHLPMTEGGKISHRLMGAAFAALTSPNGFRGRTYSGPNKAKALAKLKRLYKKEALPLPNEKAVPPETTDDTEDGTPMSELDLANFWGVPNCRAITDAPKLRERGSNCCGNCKFFKWLPTPDATAYTSDGPVPISLPTRGICSEHEFDPESNLVCDDHKDWEPEDELVEEKATKAYNIDNSFVTKLQPIKMVGETRAAGYGCYFSRDEREKDVVGTRFKKSTNLGHFYDKAPILYHHGMVKAFGLDEIASPVKAQIDDVGVWLEIELDRSKAYWKKVKANIEKGIYYFSGGSAEHLIDTAPNGDLKAFPIFEWSITTTPAEWRLGASQFYKSLGIDLEDRGDGHTDDTGDEESRQKRENQKPEVRNETTANTSEVVKMELTPEQLASQIQTAIKAAMDAEHDTQRKAAEEAEKTRVAEENKQKEIKAEVEKQVAAFKASLPAVAEQRPGYGRFNINYRPMGDGFSFSKAIRGIALQTDGKQNPWSGAERERDVMTKYANEVRASLAEGSGSLGGYLVPPEYLQDQFIPLLRARAVVRQAGARTYPAKSDTVYIPSQTGGATAAWYGENSTLSASNLTFGQLIINIKKLGALEYVSNELLADASPDADTLLKEDLANVIALKEDSTFLMSNGAAPTWANAPVGFANYAGTSAVSIAALTSNGGALAIGDLFKFKLAMMKANVPFDNSMAWFCSPTVWDQIGQFKDGMNRYQLETLTGGNISSYPAYGAYPEGTEGSTKGSIQGRIFGYPVYVTANITEDVTYGNTTTTTYMFFARMNDVFIAERAGLELMASNVAGTAFASDQTWVRGIMREGLGIRHAPAVAVAAGLTTV